MSMNILGISGESFYILHNSKVDDRSRMANLLLVARERCKHYATIKNLSQLLVSSNGEHQHKQHFCMNCLQGFLSEASRDKHYGYCKDHEVVRIDMPKAGINLTFYHGHYQFRVLGRLSQSLSRK